jgi:hypothetical protein
VSQKREKKPTRDTQLTPDYQAWRAEIEAFCRQTINHLQELIEAAEIEAPTELTATPTDAPRRPAVNAPPAATEVQAKAPAADVLTPGDLDTSQDRLAVLKRELAAKLSNVKRDQK